MLGNGQQIHFWRDRWLVNQPLLDFVSGDLPTDQLGVLVKDMWENGSGWLFDRIAPYVPQDICLRLGAVVVDNVTGAKDRLSWGESSDGSFTVKSAYALVSHDYSPKPDQGSFWSRIWGLVVPERVKVFLWLVRNQAIMSNTERYRRHLCVSSICQVCKGGEETIIHILRGCPAMAGIWQRVVPRGKVHRFFTQSLLEWLYDNLSGEINTEQNSWSTLFGMALWWGW